MHFVFPWFNKGVFLSCLNSVVDFKDEEFVSKAIETMNKYDLNGRPLNIKEVCTLYGPIKRGLHLMVEPHTDSSFFNFFFFFCSSSSSSSSFNVYPHLSEPLSASPSRTLMENMPAVCCSAWEANKEAPGVRTWALVE